MKHLVIKTNTRAITEAEAREAAVSKAIIKGFNIYFCNIKGHLGYSCLVFKNDHHIEYADDYQLHHAWLVEKEGIKALHDYFIESLNRKLFTEEEIAEPLTSYDEFEAKNYFLRNYYNMQVDYVSCFAINPSKDETKKFEKDTADMHYDPVSFCYIADKEFVEHHKQLMATLLRAKNDVKGNYQYQKEAFLSEMYNHEYAYNWDADYETLSAFGRITYRQDGDINKYFDELNFNDIQRKAYRDAVSEYSRREVA